MQTSSHQAAVKSLSVTDLLAKVYSTAAVHDRAEEEHVLRIFLYLRIPERKEKAYLMTHRHVFSVLKCHVLDLSAVLC